MRFWEKNFFITLTLFTALFFTCIFFITAISFSSALSSERETALREEYLLSMSIQRDISEIEPESASTSLSSDIAGYSVYYRGKGIYLSLSKNNTIIYSSLPIDPGASTVGDDTRVLITVSTYGSKYLCIEDTLGNAGGKYTFIYLKDISSIYGSQNRQTFILLIMGGAVSIVFVFALYFTLKRIYRPVGSLAHELRTPLTAIRGYAEYLQAAVASEAERYSASQYIIDESKRLSDVCEKLLIMANLREGDIPFEDVSVKELFENAKMTYKSVEYNDTAQAIRGNKALLQSMINNLVSNALKASRPGETVRLSVCGNVIEVSDTGKGMSKQTLSRITKMGSSDRNGEKSGNGLGIPLCYQIVRLHNGKLKFDSIPGEGTKVLITFTS